VKLVVALKKQVQNFKMFVSSPRQATSHKFPLVSSFTSPQHANPILDVAVSLDWPFLLLWMNVLDGIMQEPVPSPLCPKISPHSEIS
jgi:hypothetical protein